MPTPHGHALGTAQRAQDYFVPMDLRMVGHGHPWTIYCRIKSKQVPNNGSGLFHKVGRSRGPGQNHCTKHTTFLQIKHTFPVQHTPRNCHRQQHIIHGQKFSQIRCQAGHYPTLSHLSSIRKQTGRPKLQAG